MPGLTPSQTVGPYFHLGLDWPEGWRLVPQEAPGPRLTLTGRVLDGAGEPVTDALLELWQADAAGNYHTRPTGNFRGFGRSAVDADGRYRFETLKPGRAGQGEAPHLKLIVFARGLMLHLHTRVYFPDEAAANAQDPVLAVVPVARRPTLLARATDEGHVFDIHLQGVQETVFFDA